MEKVITTRQFAAIKRVAQNVAPMVQRKAKVVEKLKELSEEYKSLQAQIDGFEGGIQALCGGLSTEDLVHREVETLNKLDKDGRPLKKVSYQPNNCLVYDSVKNAYILHIPTDKPEVVSTNTCCPSENTVSTDEQVPTSSEAPANDDNDIDFTL